MRQTYYGVEQASFISLEQDISKYSQYTRDLFNPGFNHEEKVAIEKAKLVLKEKIQENLAESGRILGFLTMEKVENLQADLKTLEDGVSKRALQSNMIPYDKLEDLLFYLMGLPASEPLKNIRFFLERARQKKQSIIVWIM
jgi:hypothetical protein